MVPSSHLASLMQSGKNRVPAVEFHPTIEIFNLYCLLQCRPSPGHLPFDVQHMKLILQQYSNTSAVTLGVFTVLETQNANSALIICRSSGPRRAVLFRVTLRI